jgi:pimeloyl-ACP methyl ester carboxylesterase
VIRIKKLILCLICSIFVTLISAHTYADDLPPPPTSIDIKKAHLGKVEIAYYIRGQGKPLVMIMGFKGTMAHWDPELLKELEKHYTLILFDNRGVGLSSDTSNNLTTIEQMADDTAALIKAVGYPHANVLGWSMGARIAQQVAVRHPDVVEKLILCAPNAGGEHQVEIDPLISEMLVSSDLSDQEKLELLFPKTASGMAAGQDAAARIRAAVADGTIPTDFEVSDKTISRQIKANKLWNNSEANWQALTRIKAPTLVSDGLEDILDPPANARMIAEQIPYTWSAFFVNAGHAFLFQNYQRFANLVFAFVG